MSEQATEQRPAKYVTRVERGWFRRGLHLVASEMPDGAFDFEMYGPKDKRRIPRDAVRVKPEPALAPNPPKNQVMVRGVSPERQEAILATAVWSSFAARSLALAIPITYTAGRFEEHGRTMELRANTGERFDAPTVGGDSYRTRPTQVAAAVVNIAMVTLPAQVPQIRPVF